MALTACSAERGNASPAAAEDPPNVAYQDALNRWLNHSEADLVSAWGVPDRSQRLITGGQALEYQRTDSEGQTVCTTLFNSDIYGMIRTWTYRGTDCEAPHLNNYGP